MIIIIFIIHVNYYTNLYDFNFSKVFKEEFFDLYITQLDDLNTELTPIIVKETKIDIENHLFFQAYFKELSSVGFIDENKNFLQNFTEESATIFSRFNNIQNVDVNFSIPLDKAKDRVDNRNNDKLGGFAKIYYYMFPYIWQESFFKNLIINQSFFMAYEFEDGIYRDYYSDTEEEIRIITKDNPLYFRFPNNKYGAKMDNNFVPNSYFLNPFIENSKFEHHLITENYYREENWFKMLDYDFRNSI
jgi:hypothetical protein